MDKHGYGSAALTLTARRLDGHRTLALGIACTLRSGLRGRAGYWPCISITPPTPQQPQTHGTFMDGSRVAPNKPVVMKDGAVIVFGGEEGATTYVVRCESAAEKRRGDSGGEQQLERKRSAPGGALATVRASHLLVKHRNVRRPSSWKVGACLEVLGGGLRWVRHKAVAAKCSASMQLRSKLRASPGIRRQPSPRHSLVSSFGRRSSAFVPAAV
jgi:hypothetical protein